MGRKKKVLETSGVGTQLSLLQLDNSQNNGTPEQQAFIKYDGKSSIILSSVAGSGKTFSSIQRLKELLNRGVDPSKIIFFSFTKAATDELIKRIGRDDIKITTIHAFCMSVLTKIGKFKKISTFYEFIEWFREKYKPSFHASREDKDEFYKLVSELYDDGELLSSKIAAFKLQSADGIKCQVPKFMNSYNEFMKETKSRDFSDMLIETLNYLKEDKWLKLFKNKYDFVFLDEYQDTSTIQQKIILSLNPKHCYLMGDRFQSIYNYSGANCDQIEEMLRSRRETTDMHLTVNFRSDKNIIENSNKYSNLKAVANSQEEGFVNKKILLKIDELLNVIKETRGELAILVRTNDVIRKIELELLKRKIPMRYFNYFHDTDLKAIKKGEIHHRLEAKFEPLKKYFSSLQELYVFIESNKSSNKFVTSIHKSKGREYDYCVIVNSVSPDVLEENGFLKLLKPKQLKAISFDYSDEDMEPRNIHYVAVSRPKHGLYFMIYEA